MNRWLGIDIGGANIKMADAHHFARSVPFPLWKFPNDLPSKLVELFQQSPPFDCLALTMTGELADCFSSKREGVAAILHAAESAAGSRSLAVYRTDGTFVDCNQAQETPHLVAASNWHALARLACRLISNQDGMLIDVGSTTTDLIPLSDGKPAARGKTDLQRTGFNELVYTGVDRSPICGIVHELQFKGRPHVVAQEWFSTALDAYLLLGGIDEAPENRSTADGRPATRLHAARRLSRMLCADDSEITRFDAVELARQVRSQQMNLLRRELEKVVSAMNAKPSIAVLSGQGEFLARDVLTSMEWNPVTLSLSAELGDVISACGPAFAIASLAGEQETGHV